MFQLSGVLFPEPSGSKTPYSGKLRIRRCDLEVLGKYLSHAPAVTNSHTGESEVILYLKGWHKGGNATAKRYISLAAEPATAVVNELSARGVLPEDQRSKAWT